MTSPKGNCEFCLGKQNPLFPVGSVIKCFVIPSTKNGTNCEKMNCLTLAGTQICRGIFQVFAKNSLIKNIFEEEKKFYSKTLFFLENSYVLGVFWPRRGLSEKVQYFRNQAIQNGLNEANTAFVNKRSFTFKLKFCGFQGIKT